MRSEFPNGTNGIPISFKVLSMVPDGSTLSYEPRCEKTGLRVSKFNVGLKSLLHQGLSEPEFYGDLVYKLKKD